jgi:mono/diheme cytochrome c family protein
MIRKAFFLLMLTGCAPTLYRPTPLDPVSLQTGRDLYVEHCSVCHRLRRPEKYEASRWPALVEKMNKNAHLSDEEKGLVVNYLQTASLRLQNRR